MITALFGATRKPGERAPSKASGVSAMAVIAGPCGRINAAAPAPQTAPAIDAKNCSTATRYAPPDIALGDENGGNYGRKIHLKAKRLDQKMRTQAGHDHTQRMPYLPVQIVHRRPFFAVDPFPV
ncbi:MAG: hypothetical protein WAT09_05035 [Paracoccaceae bacterium]